MKKSSVKCAMTVICVLAAGVCYSCGGISGGGDASGDQILIHEEEKTTADDAGSALSDWADTAEDTVPRENSLEASIGAEDTAWGGSGLSAGENELSGESATGTSCFVHVCGEVLNPGVYELKAGGRIFEAVELAGGFTDEAASSYLNLAQEIADGMKIVVPSEEELEAAAAGNAGADGGSLSGMADAGVTSGNSAAGTAGAYTGGYGVFTGTGEASSEPGSSKVNINTADMAALMTLKGIGAAKAEDIISYRDSNGPFRSIEDIMKVPGIKNAAFEKIKDDITV